MEVYMNSFIQEAKHKFDKEFGRKLTNSNKKAFCSVYIYGS